MYLICINHITIKLPNNSTIISDLGNYKMNNNICPDSYAIRFQHSSLESDNFSKCIIVLALLTLWCDYGINNNIKFSVIYVAMVRMLQRQAIVLN